MSEKVSRNKTTRQQDYVDVYGNLSVQLYDNPKHQIAKPQNPNCPVVQLQRFPTPSLGCRLAALSCGRLKAPANILLDPNAYE